MSTWPASSTGDKNELAGRGLDDSLRHFLQRRRYLGRLDSVDSLAVTDDVRATRIRAFGV